LLMYRPRTRSLANKNPLQVFGTGKGLYLI